MTELTLTYKHCELRRPLRLKIPQTQQVALEARRQLVGDDTDALTLDILSNIHALDINRLPFELYISTDQVVHDENKKPVLGICEFDPGSPNAAIVCVSPPDEKTPPAKVLSTLAHEIGHAIFDAPGWIFDAQRGPGLFDAIDDAARRAFRIITPDESHLAGMNQEPETTSKSTSATSHIQFAEYRANEFMGALLVPRRHLTRAIDELCADLDLEVQRDAGWLDEATSDSLWLSNRADPATMERLRRLLAVRFGVTPEFIRIRMLRYQLLRD